MTLAWPKGDTELRKVAFDYTILEMALPYCKQRRNCIQAGGAAGTFPLWLSDRFEKVFTFEPDPLNFACLARNCERKNIIKFQAALGNSPGTAGMTNDKPWNAGTGHITGGDAVLLIQGDSLSLRNVDLIQLDLEGYEYSALLGLENTIHDSSPVIVAEHKHGDRYGVSLEEIATHLCVRGYKVVGSHGHDFIFARA